MSAARPNIAVNRTCAKAARAGYLHVRWPGSGRESAVDLAPIADLNDGDNQIVVDDLVKDAVVSLAQAILFFAAEFFAPGGTRFSCKVSNPPDDALAVFEGNGL